MSYQRKDHYYKKAKAEGKASRAVYKLVELNKQFHLIRKGFSVVDLGAAPGSWLLEIANLVGQGGKVVGIDLRKLDITLPAHVSFLLGSLEEEQHLTDLQSMLSGKADVVVSDMAPNTTGVSFADAYRSYELAVLALQACSSLLKEHGSFLVKIFAGNEIPVYRKQLHAQFSHVHEVIPKATRKTSSEKYFVCTGYKKSID